ncbi:BTAD domain-containing putative transcriptional regulator [Catellatospora sp. TT07R-123]|uniref:BTAD domain-containing putative transcriptional regulator n=1 Tax=Catellatospora sp. TT07R-123 TaxID=2733863 RepID=UPI001BB37464|nr:BTAD domain-containing putative transcriptional regulator [Catellatospora sp. TT07R-123]
MDLGQRVRLLRQQAGLTQPELAERAGLSIRAVRDIESGRVDRPRAATIGQLATALGVAGSELAEPHPAGRVEQPGVHIAVLGPLEVRRDGRPVAIGSPVQRTLLGLLALHAGEPVGRDQIVDVLWGEEPPRTCVTQLQVAVGRLRDLFEPRRGTAPGTVIGSVLGGYLLTCGVDAHRFARLAADGLLEQALDLWRGPVLAGAAYRLRGHPAAVRLAQQRIDTTLRYAEQAPRDALARLRSLAADEPLHEALHARLMLAQAAAGDRAGALSGYAELAKRLAEDLGIEPSEQLQRIHLSLLDAGPAPAAGAVRPAQLPADVPRFAGREELLELLDGLLPDSRVVALSGTAGVGKTALAVHWAYRVADRFPDGQLYVNLRGFTPGAAPVEPADALRGMLESLGAADGLPHDVDGRSALLRSLVSGRRLLIVLDDALDAGQVRPLLPGAPGCLVVVTSRRQLTELVAGVGADPVPLDPLSDDEAWRLLAARLGPQRVARESAAVADLIGLTARLPLTLTLVAAQAVLRPGLSLAALGTELREAGGLDGFTGTDIRAVFTSSYRLLAPAAAEMFRLLGLHAGPDIGVVAAASLAAVPVARARRLLADLAGAHLVTEPRPGRYGLHDLLRAYAVELAGDEPEARRRLYDHYVRTCDAGAMLLNPYRAPVVPPAPVPGAVAVELGGAEAAMTWFQEEHAALVATVDATAATGFPEYTAALAGALTTFFDRRGHWSDWARTQHAAVEAARGAGDRVGQAHAHRRLARAYTRMSRNDDAQAHLTAALDLFAALDDGFGLANSYLDLAALMENQSRYPEALDYATRALGIAPDKPSRANAHNSIGWYLGQLGRRREAFTHCEQALHLLQELGNRDGEAHAWDSVGFAYQQLDEPRLAGQCFERALALFRELGDRYYEAIVLTHLGSVSGDRSAYAAALAILEDLGHPGADEVRVMLEAAPAQG